MILASVFILVGTINVRGLIPYVYGFSCQLYFSFRLVLPLWFALFSSSVRHSFSGYLVGFVPAGCPIFLSPLIFVIELVGTLMRVFSLGGRLAASITMGHVVYNLAGYLFVISRQSFSTRIFGFILVYLVFLAELGVSVLQCWVFWFLLKTYSEEHTG